METAQECLEKVQLLGRIRELERQKAALEEDERQSQVQKEELKEQITSLTASLEESKE